MKKNIVLSLLALTAASSAFASGSPVLNCDVPGNKDLGIAVALDEHDNNTDTSYTADVDGASLQSNDGKITVDLEPAAKGAQQGYYISKSQKDGNTTKTVFEKAKVRIKTADGSVLVVDAQGNGGKDGMEATLTLVLRGKEAVDGLKDLRSVKTNCSYDYE